jgi:hypothetical protein
MRIPTFDTTNGTKYVRPVLNHTNAVARPRRTTSSWLIANSTVPTITAVSTVRERFRRKSTTLTASRKLLHVGLTVVQTTVGLPGAMKP